MTSQPSRPCDGRTADWYDARPAAEARAKNACQPCPHRQRCAELGADQPWGVWGGLSATERGYQRDGFRARPRTRAEAS